MARAASLELHGASAIRAMLIAVIVVGLVIAAMAFGVWAWPDADDDTTLRTSTPSAETERLDAVEHGRVAPQSYVDTEMQRLDAVERGRVAPAGF